MFALGVILFILEFGVPPFSMATKDNAYYRIFYRGHNNTRFFFRLHPATKDLYSRGDLDPNLCELLLALLDENPEHRPSSIKEIKEFAYFQKDIMGEDDVIKELKKRLGRAESIVQAL
jgi:serine/threonine protein kinase